MLYYGQKIEEDILETVGIFEAKTRLSAIVTEVQDGRSYIISRHGVPVAVISPIRDKRKATRGSARSDEFYMADDFDAPLKEFADYL